MRNCCYTQVTLTANEIDRLISYLRPVDQDSHLAKKLRSAREKHVVAVRRLERLAARGEKSTGVVFV